MARGRLVSKSLGSSRKFHALSAEGGKLAEFCQALFPLIVAHTDDFGRLEADAFTIKHLVWPTSARSERDFDVALNALHATGLIQRYGADGGLFLQVACFDEHQPGLNKAKRTKSKFPEPCPFHGNPVKFLLKGREGKVREVKRKITEGNCAMRRSSPRSTCSGTPTHARSGSRRPRAPFARSTRLGQCSKPCSWPS